MKGKKIFITLTIILVIAISLITFCFKKSSKGEITAGLTEFYKKDYHSILEKQSTYDCNLEVDVQTSEKVISINSECTVMPPHAAIEAFLAVARGDLEINGGKFRTGSDWNADPREAVKQRLEFINYPVVASEIKKSVKEEMKNLCFLPCVDDSLPVSFEVLTVNYTPSKEELSNLFVDYNWEKFEDLVVHSTYSYKIRYKNMERKIEWRYLLGQFETGRFDLTITFDKPIKLINCQREEIKTLMRMPSIECKVTKIDEKTFNIKGFSTGLERLIVKL